MKSCERRSRGVPAMARRFSSSRAAWIFESEKVCALDGDSFCDAGTRPSEREKPARPSTNRGRTFEMAILSRGPTRLEAADGAQRERYDGGGGHFWRQRLPSGGSTPNSIRRIRIELCVLESRLGGHPKPADGHAPFHGRGAELLSPRAIRFRLALRPKRQKPREPGRFSGLLEAGWTGLEPAASGVTGRRYNRLNYHPIF